MAKFNKESVLNGFSRLVEEMSDQEINEIVKMLSKRKGIN